MSTQRAAQARAARLVQFREQTASLSRDELVPELRRFGETVEAMLGTDTDPDCASGSTMQDPWSLDSLRQALAKLQLIEVLFAAGRSDTDG